VRLASFNVLHGRSLADGQVSTERLARACAGLDADVLALQEIDRNQARSGGVDQTAVVAEAMGAGHWRFEPALVGEPGATWRAAADDDDPASADAGYGVGLVSRLRVRRWHVVRLRAAKVKAPVAVPGGRGRFILLPDEPRVALAAEVETAGGPLVVATTHLSFVPGWNLVQLRRVTAALAALGPSGPGSGAAGAPCVLMGDLNVPGPLPAMVTGWRPLARVKTFPGARPSMQIDHALGHGLLPLVAAATARELPLSDHRALIVDFE
jgi:endonuclease/exonuclease/phosphatase family metal-dependent hydrolase